ncbi:MAG TPA: acetyl-CoA carboxylase, carboxyltransferase subunit beta [Polyangiaceae bacterium]|nr:acetyl-CoA carboxylase, carboxyltransferase subunit beta [Polyangiaceae bacterium]
MPWPNKKPPQAQGKKSLGKGVFRKCDGCGETHPAQVFNDLFEVCPSCDFHHRLGVDGWRRLLLDDGKLEPWDDQLRPADPLGFSDGKGYEDRIAAAQKATRAVEAVETGRGKLGGHAIAYGAYNFAFMGGSMGSVVGEKITRLFERAVTGKLPVVLLQASGGARMQEGILSLMQMAKMVAALERVRAARLPFISVLRDPTTGGVAASCALLGDINVAEPGALIGFAGPRVIASTIGEKLPPGFQRSEFLLSHGMIDLIVPRGEMKPTLSTLIMHLCAGKAASTNGHAKHRERRPTL